jgi:hypothetical protein
VPHTTQHHKHHWRGCAARHVPLKMWGPGAPRRTGATGKASHRGRPPAAPWGGSISFFAIVCCRRAGTDKIEHHSLILCHPEMTSTLRLGEKAASRPRFQFALVEFFGDAVIERAAQHYHVPVIGMRMGLEDGVSRPPDQLDTSF